ncbi:2'-phosphotransferase [Entamoeba marina]
MSLSRSQQTALSKNMSYLLRHGAEKNGLALTKDGWAYVSDLMKMKGFEKVQTNDILCVVNNDSKQRYSIKGEGADLMIRANQGHSLEVKIEMKEITDASLYPNVLHGTYRKSIPSIMEKGLCKMSRLHIHMAQDLPKQLGDSMSGMRSNCQVVIYIDLKKALEDKLQFFESSNGVILCEGPILPKYFSKVVNYPSLTTFEMK